MMKQFPPRLRKKFQAILFAVLVAWTAPTGAADNRIPSPGPTAVSESRDSVPEPLEGATASTRPSARSKAGKEDSMILPLLGMGIGLIAMVMSLGIAIIAIWTEYKKRQELLACVHRERMAALEKGLEVPAFPVELLDELNKGSGNGKRSGQDSGIKTGLMWLASGLGLGTFMYFQKPVGTVFTICAIPVFVGLAFLVSHWIENRRRL